MPDIDRAADIKVTAAQGTVTAEIPLAGHASEHWLELFRTHILLGVRLAFPDPLLSAAGIVLRQLVPDDIAWITAACGDRELSRYIPAMPYRYSQSDARAFAEQAARGWAEASSATFVIALLPGGQGLGMIGLHFLSVDPGLAEVGYCRCAGRHAGMARRRPRYRWWRAGPSGSWHQAAEPADRAGERGVAARGRACWLHQRGPAARLDADRHWPPRQRNVLSPTRRPRLTRCYKFAEGRRPKAARAARAGRHRVRGGPLSSNALAALLAAQARAIPGDRVLAVASVGAVSTWPQ